MKRVQKTIFFILLQFFHIFFIPLGPGPGPGPKMAAWARPGRGEALQRSVHGWHLEHVMLPTFTFHRSTRTECVP